MTEYKFIVPYYHPTLGTPSDEMWEWLETELQRRFGGWHQILGVGRGPPLDGPVTVRIYYVATDTHETYMYNFFEEVRRTFRQEQIYWRAT